MTNSIILRRYDKFFGNNTSNRLLDAKRMYSNNQFLRVNLSKSSCSEIEEMFKSNRVKYTKTFLPNSFKIEKSFFNITSSIEALSGKLYMQDLASQIPINCIDFDSLKTKEKVRVLDMAASPGSKTTQIADLLNFHKINYEIVALEPEALRLTKLINNIQKQGFENISIIHSAGEDYSNSEKFDIVLLDAPCSGNLVGDRNWLEKRNIQGIEQSAKLQKTLLKSASHLVKEQGVLIYSTCSLEIEENEMNVNWFLKNSKLKSFKPKLKFPFDVKPIMRVDGSELDKGVENSIRIMPYLSKTQGFFVCCFKL